MKVHKISKIINYGLKHISARTKISSILFLGEVCLSAIFVMQGLGVYYTDIVLFKSKCMFFQA